MANNADLLEVMKIAAIDPPVEIGQDQSWKTKTPLRLENSDITYYRQAASVVGETEAAKRVLQFITLRSKPFPDKLKIAEENRQKK